ncbi:exported hypothetical protein [Nostocoides australiense Ben110]|uniref:Uncharacterized protein n=1 Tax=Nostocoides australiense Ben110 TaxID=1193182 RepID=W6JYM1_9MICO|nr:exported hypothetical protein [Tetrasphaera australiensis Ben110]
MSLVRRIARPLLATIFITGGLDALRHPSSKAQAAPPGSRWSRHSPGRWGCPTTRNCSCAPMARR